MKKDLSAMARFKIGLIEHHHSTGKAIVMSTFEVLGKSAGHALARMRRETEGANLCVLSGEPFR